MDPVVHFELPVEDRDQASGFYEQAFGWKANWVGPEMGNDTVAQTTETDERGMVKKPVNINGGLFVKP